MRQLVADGVVRGWDDPRLATLSGLRRRGYTPAAIRELCQHTGLNKTNSINDLALLEHYVREDLNRCAPRVMAVLRPLKVVVTNYPEGQTEEFTTENNPEDPAAGVRKVPFSREVYIEQEDFMEDPPRKFFRLAPGREIRLKSAYYIRCDEVVKDPRTGEIVELRCTYDPASRGGSSPDGRKVQGTSHWVAAAHAVPAEVRLYDQLFLTEDPEQGGDFTANLNPHSLTVLQGCLVEPGLAQMKVGERCQFLRQGYFCLDPDTTAEKLVFNRVVSLKDTWEKISKK